MSERLRIGVDFDNTLADYDGLFAMLALEEGLATRALVGKRAVRDHVRAGEDGETAWRRLQALAYGPRMDGARLMDGAGRFLRACRSRGAEVFIVSHKSRRAATAEIDADLRECALDWMRAQGFFDAEVFGLDPEQVCFAETREAKVERIAELGVGHFVDDLEEVFRTPGFPGATERLLLDRSGQAAAGPYHRCRSFDEVSDACFSVAVAG